MGYYINKTSTGAELSLKKAEALINDGATKIDPPTTWKPNLVCVVNNGVFEAAAYAHSEAEMNYFLQPDGRSKIWLEYSHAKTLAE